MLFWATYSEIYTKKVTNLKYISSHWLSPKQS